ncbi:Ankyrin repeat domain-containing protein 6 [Armadillidium nasatum]|uniref:Ankyrin repeat domain-containing protein 6 n=1 Tax=Armadillidium nasatum TaxID=96803 RepID=A0A5N5TLA0_9CRUS|nr:Ankyrin repeat domain-containing protein 6 [Armadillidium nasatum]
MVEVKDHLGVRGRVTKELNRVAGEGDLEAVIRLLGLGAGVNDTHEGACCPLQRAACEGQVDVIKHLLKCGANPNAKDSQHGNTALHEASWKGFSQSAEILINAKANFDAQNHSGFAPLHLACQNGHNQTCRILLLAGCKVDIKNNYGDTPLHTASRYGHAGVTRILLSANANVKEVNKFFYTALHISTAMGKRKLTRMLLEANTNQNAKNKGSLQHSVGNTILCYQMSHKKYLVNQNETALDIAVRKGFTEIVELLCNPPPIITPEQRIRQELEQKKLESKSASKDKRKEKITDSGNSSKDSGKKKERKKHKSDSKIDPKTRASRLVNWGVEWSPYGCHVAPSSPANIPSAKLKNLPLNPLNSGEQYFVDLAGNVKKGPVGVGATCFCAPLFETVQNKMERDKIDLMDHIDAAHGKLGARISHLETRTRGQIQKLGVSVQQKISEESEQCRQRTERIERTQEGALSDRLSEMKSWVESQLSFHHPDSPQSFRRSRYNGRNYNSKYKEGLIKRSKSEETLSEIVKQNEEPLYKGLCVLDYPMSMCNIPQINIRDESLVPSSPSLNRYTEESSTTRLKYLSRDSSVSESMSRSRDEKFDTFNDNFSRQSAYNQTFETQNSNYQNLAQESSSSDHQEMAQNFPREYCLEPSYEVGKPDQGLDLQEDIGHDRYWNGNGNSYNNYNKDSYEQMSNQDRGFTYQDEPKTFPPQDDHFSNRENLPYGITERVNYIKRSVKAKYSTIATDSFHLCE